MKKISIILAITLLISSLSCFGVGAKQPDEVCSYVNYNGDTIYYYKDINDDTYVFENGERVYVAVPVSVEEITDPDELAMLRNDAEKKSLNISAKSSDVLYSRTMTLSPPYNTTPVLTLSKDYFYLKCSNLNPSSAKRGFSYYISYSADNSTWFKALYVNKSLTLYTRHARADLGNASYIKIQIWSYYGTVSSCLFSVKEGGVLG